MTRAASRPVMRVLTILAVIVTLIALATTCR